MKKSTCISAGRRYGSVPAGRLRRLLFNGGQHGRHQHCCFHGASSTAESDAPLEGEITFWHSFTQGARMEAVQKAADKFMEANPGVRSTSRPTLGATSTPSGMPA